MPTGDVISGHYWSHNARWWRHQRALQFAAATWDSLRDEIRWLEIYYAYTKITRQACSYRRQNRRKDAERSMVKTATNPNNTYSSRDAYIIDRRLYTYMDATVKIYEKVQYSIACNAWQCRWPRTFAGDEITFNFCCFWASAYTTLDRLYAVFSI